MGLGGQHGGGLERKLANAEDSSSQRARRGSPSAGGGPVASIERGLGLESPVNLDVPPCIRVREKCFWTGPNLLFFRPTVGARKRSLVFAGAR